MSHDPQRKADLVEIDELCARYSAFPNQLDVDRVDRGLAVFRPLD
jgi:hypothetical protein